MMEHLIREDTTQEDNIQHKNARRVANIPIDTLKNQEFMLNEVRKQ